MLNKELLPKHVAVIMDGNGRWAQKNKVNRVAGHNAGMLAMKEIIKRADIIGIKYLTVYAFSTENWKRSAEEVGGIFGLLVKYVASELEELNENNVKVRILGDYTKIPKVAVNSIEKALMTTKDNDGLQFSIALNYGGRQEIVRAVRQICYLVETGELKGQEIDEELVSSYLYTGIENQNIPDPDLIIRTSGEERISNFLLWQGAYSEMAFSDSLWPDFTPDEFERMIEEYTRRDRRYGGRK
ncbi:MAG: isoprenyl transferase [Firmicutes bacterium]|jgi:undecaprenyl diphosphate synthase|nr:isoprenyl transferase [Bacillota bacterium]